jgi:hypothetical protein
MMKLPKDADMRKAREEDGFMKWDRNHGRTLEIRTAKNGRVYASQGYDVTVTWSIRNGKPFNKNQIIGATMSRAKGKKGGWYISLHLQKAVFSQKHNKFVFCNRWTHYWASDQMIKSRLWACMDKKSKAELVSPDQIVKFVEQAKDLL